MSEVTFQVQLSMPLEEWKDHCFGSGWTMWEWWYDARIDERGGITAEWFEDCDDPDSRIEKGFMPFQALAHVASEVAAWSPMVRRQLLESDFDADGMDIVMQQAFMGEVIYG